MVVSVGLALNKVTRCKPSALLSNESLQLVSSLQSTQRHCPVCVSFSSRLGCSSFCRALRISCSASEKLFLDRLHLQICVCCVVHFLDGNKGAACALSRNPQFSFSSLGRRTCWFMLFLMGHSFVSSSVMSGRIKPLSKIGLQNGYSSL